MSSLRQPDACLAMLTRKQFGLLTKAQALEAGLTYRQLWSRLHNGTLVRVEREVYRLAGAPQSWDQTALAAVLAVGGDAVLCGRAAATVWKLPLPEPEQIEVLAPRWTNSRDSSGPVVVRRSRAYRQEDLTQVGVFPVTTIQRTLVDLAASLKPDALDRVVDNALSRQLTTPARLHKVVLALGGRGRRGTATLRSLVEPWLDHEDMDSVAEAAWLRALKKAGLPEPVSQYSIVRADGKRAKVDFAWPEAKLVLEVDGYQWHSSPRSHSKDMERATALEAAGWRVMRTTPTQLAERPGPVLVAIRQHLTAATTNRPIASPDCSTLETAGHPAAGR